MRDFKKHNPRFISYYLTRIDFRSHSGKSGVPGVNRNDLHKLPVNYPTDPEEEHAIARALSDVDGLFGALEKLIAKKRAIKQAAMQQLLTGKTRLPGFSGKWRECQLGDLGQFSKGRGIKRDDVTDEGLPCIRYGEIYTRFNNFTRTMVSHIPASVAADALPIRPGDLLFTASGETADEIGKCVAYLGEAEAYAGGDTIVLRLHGDDSPLYLGHLLNHPSVAQQKARLGQGDAIVHISARNLGSVALKLPEADEQATIAGVLAEMDAEIAALERRRDKTKAIKQGMMQQLLTGGVRLVQPKVSQEVPV